MLEPALFHRKELLNKSMGTLHNKKYMWYTGANYYTFPSVLDDISNHHQFASINKSNEVIGYISYHFSLSTKSCTDLNIIKYDNKNYISSVIFAKDVLSAIYDCFFKYDFNRIEWNCYADSPQINMCRKFIKKYGGHEAGYLHSNAILMDEKLHDTVIFEIMKDEFKRIK